MIDSGVDAAHPDLAASLWSNPGEVCGDGVDNDGNGYVDDCHGYNFADDGVELMGSSSHGTHCSGTVAAATDNALGVAGGAGTGGGASAALMTSVIFGENDLATIADAVMRIRTCDVPSLLCLSYSGEAAGPGAPSSTSPPALHEVRLPRREARS